MVIEVGETFAKDTYQHECWGSDHPTCVPVPIYTEPNHCFNAIVHFLSSEYPANGNRLKESTP